MKLTPRVITILQNFQKINPSIAVYPGNVMKTISDSLNVMAKATIQEEFPIEFGIYDLSKFLALASLVKEPEIEFLEKYMLIKSGHTTIRYVYCDTEMMIKPERDVKLPSVYVEFELKQEAFTSVDKAMKILKYNNFVIQGDGKNIKISAEHEKNKTAETLSIVIGETDKVFRAVIEEDKMKILDMNYLVQFSESGIAYFKGDDVEYWISMHASSTFG